MGLELKILRSLKVVRQRPRKCQWPRKLDQKKKVPPWQTKKHMHIKVWGLLGCLLAHLSIYVCVLVSMSRPLSAWPAVFSFSGVSFCLVPEAASLVFTLLFSIVPTETGSQAASLSYSRPWPRSWRQTLPCMCYVNGSARGCSSIHLSPLSPICPLRIMVSSSPTRSSGLWMTLMSTEWLSTRWELEAR